VSKGETWIYLARRDAQTVVKKEQPTGSCTQKVEKDVKDSKTSLNQKENQMS